MRVSIVGSRRRNSEKDKDLVIQVVRKLKEKFGKELLLVSGGCPEGADHFMEVAAQLLDIPTEIWFPVCSHCNKRIEDRKTHPCNKNKKLYEFVKEYYARNEEVAINSEMMVALVAGDRKGGTENTIKHAEKLGRKIVLL